MSNALPARPTATEASHAFALVVSRYNGTFTTALEQNAREELLAIDPDSRIETFDAPGSFEVPLIVKLLAERDEFDAILALGLILQGQTRHADLIAESITFSLQDIALTHRTPIVHEVLLVENESQARARCLEPEINRGREAARTAVAAVQAVHAALAI